jgi:hypothetical protein
MALDPTTGTGGTSFGTIPPAVFGGGGGNAPPIFTGPGFGGFGGVPSINLPAALLTQQRTPTINTPDYNAILSQLMGPSESAFAAQMAALEDQAAHQRGFAEEAYGINKAGDQAGYDTWLKDFLAKLTGRGMYASGARTYYTRIQSEALKRQLGLLANQLHSYLYGLQSQVTNARLSGQGQLASQRAAYGMQLPSAYPATTTYPAPLF